MSRLHACRVACAAALCSSSALAQLSDLRDVLVGPTGSWFGISAAVLGDWNGDGHDELAVGAQNYPGGGLIQILSGADLSVYWEDYGSQGGQRLGGAVTGARDVNADGFHDLLVGAPGGNFVRAYSGEWIVRTAAGLTPQSALVLHEIHGPVSSESFGGSLLGGLNMDNDGRYDFLVGAVGFPSGPAPQAGVVRAYAGADGSLLWERTGVAQNDKFGISMAKIRPNNAYDSDGMQDYLIGVPGQGEVHVLSGPTGNTIATISPPAPGEYAGHRFGESVAVVGDTDGDGRDDFVVGAPFYLPNSTPGTTFGGVFLFQSQGPDCAAFGDQGGFHVGSTVIGLGDIDGDRVDDFGARTSNILSYPTVYSGVDCALLDTLQPPSGSANKIFGGGDLDNDGLNDVLTANVSADTVYVYDTANLVVPAFVESAWLVGTTGAPRPYVTVSYPTADLLGKTAVLEVEYDLGSGWTAGPSTTFQVPLDADPQEEVVWTFTHGAAYLFQGQYDYRVRVSELGTTPGAWSDAAGAHPSADRTPNWIVDTTDLGAWAGALNSSIGDPDYDPLSDFNQDGTVGVVDLAIWINWRDLINAG